MRKLFLVVLLGFASPFLAVSSAPAQCAVYCDGGSIDGNCYCNSGWHHVEHMGFPYNNNTTGEHSICKVNPGGHGSCFAEDVDQVSYTALVAAASDGDAERVLKLASRLPDYVVVNRERNTVMIMSCTGKSFIANLHFKESATASRLTRDLETLQAARARFAAVVGRIGALGL